MSSFLFNIFPEYLINSAGVNSNFLIGKGQLYSTLLTSALNYEVVKDYKTLNEFSNFELSTSRKALVSNIDSYSNNDESSSDSYYKAYDIPCSSLIVNNPSLSAYKYLNNYSTNYNSDEYLYFDIDEKVLALDTSCILLNDINWVNSNIYAEGILIYACNDLSNSGDFNNIPLAYYDFWKPIKSISGNINIEWDNRGVIIAE